MIKLRDLEYLIAIDKYRHFGKAAASCFVSQPTLSGQIIKLEESLALTLIERKSRQVLLTYAGEKLVQEAKKVINAANNFEVKAKSLIEPLSGDLHIGLIPTLAPYLLPFVMKDLTLSLPGINFYLYENKTQVLLKGLEEGKFDALILPYLDGMEMFTCEPLFSEPFILACSSEHKFSEKEAISLSDLNNQDILTLEDGHCLRDQAMGYCFSAGANENQSFRATSLETLRHMVSTGMGITLMPALATFTHEVDVNYVNFTAPAPSRDISILTRKDYSRMECIDKISSVIKSSLSSVL